MALIDYKISTVKDDREGTTFRLRIYTGGMGKVLAGYDDKDEPIMERGYVRSQKTFDDVLNVPTVISEEDLRTLANRVIESTKGFDQQIIDEQLERKEGDTKLDSYQTSLKYV